MLDRITNQRLTEGARGYILLTSLLVPGTFSHSPSLMMGGGDWHSGRRHHDPLTPRRHRCRDATGGTQAPGRVHKGDWTPGKLAWKPVIGDALQTRQTFLTGLERIIPIVRCGFNRGVWIFAAAGRPLPSKTWWYEGRRKPATTPLTVVDKEITQQRIQRAALEIPKTLF